MEESMCYLKWTTIVKGDNKETMYLQKKRAHLAFVYGCICNGFGKD